jgi:hypothetical protein
MRVLPVQESDMGGDMELRGIYHYEFANEDWLITEELAGLGIRVARNVAQIELFELVDIISKELKLIDIVARQAAGHRVGLNMDSVRPVVQIRAMGTTARVIDLPYYERDPSYLGYVKEIVDDAMGLVSLELGQRISPRDYAVWFIETLSSMLGFMHRKDVSPDFRKQIHSGTHTVTLDCRLLDTHAYDTPQGMQRERLRQIETCRTRPELSWLYDKPKLTREEVEANNLEVEREDIRRTLLILKNLVGGVETVYDLGNLKGEIKKRFGAAYGRTYVPIKNRHAPVNS